MADLNRTAVELPIDVSNEIWAKTQDESAIMKLARKIELPGRGIAVPVITGDAEASWVAETAKKPVSNPSFDVKYITPYKLAVVETVSMEFARDYKRLYDEMLRRLPKSLGNKFDATVFSGVDIPVANFDTLNDVAGYNLKKNAYKALVEADTAIAEAGYLTNGYAISPQGKGILLNAVDDVNRPLFINSVAEGAIPQILGHPVEIAKPVYVAETEEEGTEGQEGYVAPQPAIVGFAGDWDNAVWGSVEGIKLRFSDQATVGDINLFEQNMLAVIAEVEVGFRCVDKDAFAKFTA